MNYSYLDQPQDYHGFTNNWLTARHNDNLFVERYPDFPLYDEPRQNTQVYSTTDNGTYRDILKGIMERSPVSDMFFSKKNLDHLKMLICKQVYNQSSGKYNLSPHAQSDNELLTIMRAIYLEQAKHLPTGFREQVGELNLKVLIEVVPRVMSKVQQELSYQRDHGSQPLPLPLPIHMSSAGTRSNRSVTDLFI